jgi:hypothetical protein
MFEKLINLVIVFILIFGVIGYVISIPIVNFNDHTYVITVTDKERVNKDSDSRYLIFAEKENGDTIVFENTDNWFKLKVNSSEKQGQLKIGEKYKLTVVGYRIPILSWYENIIKIEKVD